MSKNIITLVAVVLVAFYAGYLYKDVDMYSAVEKHPRGTLNIPAQWLMMDTLVGWDKMILVVGYADNVEVCQHLSEIAEADAPDRDFRCTDAN